MDLRCALTRGDRDPYLEWCLRRDLVEPQRRQEAHDGGGRVAGDRCEASVKRWLVVSQDVEPPSDFAEQAALNQSLEMCAGDPVF